MLLNTGQYHTHTHTHTVEDATHTHTHIITLTLPLNLSITENLQHFTFTENIITFISYFPHGDPKNDILSP